MEGELRRAGATPRSLPRAGRDLGLLTLLWALLFVPGFARREFVNEEGRRALPAREMVESGDYVLPRIYGTPYLSKPPAYFWMVAAVSVDGVTTASARLPALVATLVTALLVLLVGERWRRGAGLPAGALFLISPLVLEKGALGEIEAPFALLCFAGAVAAVRAGAERHWPGLAWSLLAGALFGLATLTKGPPAAIFLVATLAGMAWAPAIGLRRTLARSGPLLLAGAAVVGLWIVPLVRQMDPDTLRSTWAGEVLGVRRGPWVYLRHRIELVSGFLFGLLPASALVLTVLLRPAERRRWLASAHARIALVTLAVVLLFFLVYPVSRPRYLYPLAPWAALLGGRLLADLFAGPGVSPEPRVVATARWTGGLVGALGLGCALVAAFHAFLLPLLDAPVDGVGLALVVVMGAAGALALLAARRGRAVPVLALGLVALIGARLFELTQLKRSHADHYARRRIAAELDQAVTAARGSRGEVYLDSWGDFNLLAHAKTRVRFLDGSRETPGPGDLLLHPVPCRGAGAPGPRDPVRPCPESEEGWHPLGRFPALNHAHELVLFERRRPPAAAEKTGGGRGF